MAFQFEVSAALSDELIEQWQADGLQFTPMVVGETIAAATG